MSRFYLLFPQLLLLIIPFLLLLFWRARTGATGSAVRLLMLVCLTILAAIPLARIGGKGIDVVVVADLSRSMPSGSRDREIEIIRLLETNRAAGDRVGIVTYGREARIERLPEEFSEAGAFMQEVDGDGSDLGGAIGLASSLIPHERPGRIIVLSDGEANGSPVEAAAYEAAARGIALLLLALPALPALAWAGTIAGAVFEDVAYGGGAGRALVAAAGVPRPDNVRSHRVRARARSRSHSTPGRNARRRSPIAAALLRERCPPQAARHRRRSRRNRRCAVTFVGNGVGRTWRGHS